MADGPSNHPQPTQIILFLENLWEFAGTDEAAYREEIRITYLHELGHYFGMDEDDYEAAVRLVRIWILVLGWFSTQAGSTSAFLFATAWCIAR